MSKAHTPEQLAALEPRARQLVNEELDLSSRERALLNVILTWSMKRGREWAFFEGYDHLGGLSGLDRTHASTCVKKLQGAGLLHCTKKYGLIRCRFLPGGALIEPEKKLDPRILAELVDRAERMNEMPEGFEPNGQAMLNLKTVEEKLDDDLARESRERAIPGAGGSAELPQVENPKRTESVRLSEMCRKSIELESAQNVPIRYDHSRERGGAHDAHASAGAPVHVMRKPTAFMSDDNERVGAGGSSLRSPESVPTIPWGELHDALMADIHEVCQPATVTFKQERDWRSRIHLKPAIVREAILETQRAKKEDKIRNKDNPGGFLNVVYLDFSGEKKMPKPWEAKR